MDYRAVGVASVGLLVFVGLAVLATQDSGDFETSGNISVSDEGIYSAHSSEDLVSNMQSGGVGQDSIPSIDQPGFIDTEESELTDDEIVFGVEYEDRVVAYPRSMMVQHEIVNDEFGNGKASITYCPLTRTPMGYDADVELGVSGQLVNSNLVMYDRDSESYWSQITGSGIQGDYEGESLEEFRVIWTEWGNWKERHPETEVMEETEFARNYDADPYENAFGIGNYYETEDTMFSVMSEDDSRPNKEVVLGYRNSQGAVAFDYEKIETERVIETEVGDQDYVLIYDEGLETGRMYENPENQEIIFENGGYLIDGESFEAYDLPLNEVPAFDAYWFAWHAFYPDADIHE